jgi:hypothetical protein
MTQTDIGFETAKKLWYIKSFTNNRQFLGVQLVYDSNIKLDNVKIDTYAWAHEKYPEASNGRLRFFDDKVSIEKHGSVADSILVEGETDFTFTALPLAEIELQFNLPEMDWILTIGDKSVITRNLVGRLTGRLINDRKRFIIKQPESLLYSPEVTLINSNLRIA